MMTGATPFCRSGALCSGALYSPLMVRITLEAGRVSVDAPFTFFVIQSS